MASKLRIGVIGCGGIAQHAHMPGYAAVSDRCEMVAFCDVNEDSARKMGEKFGVTRIVTDYRHIVDDPEIDAVSVTTPNKFHFQPTMDALAAGKHVLCEKPLAMNGDEARQMCRLAREKGLILQVGLQNRFTAAARFAKQYIDAGHMGDIYYARAWALRRRGVPGWGVFINKELQGGGPLIDIGVHILDFTLYFMGYPKPVSAFGKTWDQMGKDPALFNGMGDYDRSKFTVEDFAVGLIRFENGAYISLESSFMANLEGNPFKTQLFGTKSGMVVTPFVDNPIQIYTEQDQQLFDLNPANLPHVESSYVDQVKAFVTAIQEGQPSPVPGENGLTLNAIFDAIYKSSVTGHEEPVDVSL